MRAIFLLLLATKKESNYGVATLFVINELSVY